MDTLARLTIEAECTRLMNRFNWAVDAMDYDQVLSLFISDYIFSRADKSFHGHAGLRQSLEKRPEDRITRHIVSNIVIDVADTDRANGKAYCLVSGHRRALPAGVGYGRDLKVFLKAGDRVDETVTRVGALTTHIVA